MWITCKFQYLERWEDQRNGLHCEVVWEKDKVVVELVEKMSLGLGKLEN